MAPQTTIICTSWRLTQQRCARRWIHFRRSQWETQAVRIYVSGITSILSPREAHFSRMMTLFSLPHLASLRSFAQGSQNARILVQEWIVQIGSNEDDYLYTMALVQSTAFSSVDIPKATWLASTQAVRIYVSKVTPIPKHREIERPASPRTILSLLPSPSRFARPHRDRHVLPTGVQMWLKQGTSSGDYLRAWLPMTTCSRQASRTAAWLAAVRGGDIWPSTTNSTIPSPTLSPTAIPAPPRRPYQPSPRRPYQQPYQPRPDSRNVSRPRRGRLRACPRADAGAIDILRRWHLHVASSSSCETCPANTYSPGGAHFLRGLSDEEARGSWTRGAACRHPNLP